MRDRTTQPQAIELPGNLNHAELFDLLGYNVAQASIPVYKSFDKYIGKPFELTRTEYTVLVLVDRNAEVTPSQLSAALSVTGPAITSLLGNLQTRDLLERTRSATDGRIHHLSLTSTGKATLRKARTAARAMEADLAQHLSAAEYEQLKTLLLKMALSRHG